MVASYHVVVIFGVFIFNVKRRSHSMAMCAHYAMPHCVVIYSSQFFRCSHFLRINYQRRKMDKVTPRQLLLKCMLKLYVEEMDA